MMLLICVVFELSSGSQEISGGGQRGKLVVTLRGIPSPLWEFLKENAKKGTDV